MTKVAQFSDKRARVAYDQSDAYCPSNHTHTQSEHTKDNYDKEITKIRDLKESITDVFRESLANQLLTCS